VQAVRRYLDDEPLERFGTARPPLRIRGWARLDVDGDGVPEIVLWTEPWYRQSPAITVFAVAADGMARPLVEGFAPGPLVPPRAGLRDPHAQKLGADIVDRAAESERAAGAPMDHGRAEGFGNAAVAAALHGAMHVVRYPAFVHTDGRIQTAGSYVDLSLEAGPFAGATSCAGFDFAPVDAVAAGSLAGDGAGRYVAAVAGGRVDLYRLDGFQPNGTFVKKRWTMPEPPGFARFVGGGPITYETVGGQRIPLPKPQQ